MTELYTMQRYLQYERLQELNMTHFDCWASRFGETRVAAVGKSLTKGYELIRRNYLQVGLVMKFLFQKMSSVFLQSTTGIDSNNNNDCSVFEYYE